MKILLILFFFVLCSSKVTPIRHEKLEWLNMNELNEKEKLQSKPVILDLYTNWCYWCKVMDKKTYSNSKVISYINEHFYAVKFDAESKEKVQWANREFDFNETYKVNDFTMYVTSDQPGFPSTVIFADDQSQPVTLQGFMEPKELEPILKYFGEGANKTKSFNDFSSTFKKTW